MKKRIWELDALRGICVLGMVLVHLIYDLTEMYGLVDWEYTPLFDFIKNYGGILFVLISGLCASFGGKHLSRGLTVLGCGLLCTLVTLAMALPGLTDFGTVIWFGVLHCLGLCMLLWHPLRHLPTWALPLVGLPLAVAGHILFPLELVDHPWFILLGITPGWFVTPDYFPLLPHLGYFLLGAFLGRTLYKTRESLLPGVPQVPPLRFFQWCGRRSLIIYLAHQPVLMAVCMLLSLL